MADPAPAGRGAGGNRARRLRTQAGAHTRALAGEQADACQGAGVCGLFGGGEGEGDELSVG